MRAATTDTPAPAPVTNPAGRKAPIVQPTGLEPSNQFVREGGFEKPLVVAQAMKMDKAQAKFSDALKAYEPGASLDVIVVGAGPAGLKLAGELGQRGLKVLIVGRDLPFTNNYGVWLDEFKALGLGHLLDNIWEDCLCYFGEGNEVRVGRPYGRVGRGLLRKYLIDLINGSGNVSFLEGEVADIQAESSGRSTTVTLASGRVIDGRHVTLAAGAAAAKFLSFEQRNLEVAAQTAYGIEAEVEGYEGSYDPKLMLFMDYRRHHTGIWSGTANSLVAGEHPNAGDGLWGTADEAPSFLYAMPLSDGKFFLEETCLVTKPALPFSVLQRRLERRLAALNIKVKKVHDTEWSYIPVGGPLPARGQAISAFGASANMIHPATGYSLTRSMQEAVAMADHLTGLLKGTDRSNGEVSVAVWDRLWDSDRRKVSSFQVFGMELLAGLDLNLMNHFFDTFFRLPRKMWVGFLSSKLSAVEVLFFAFTVFVLAPLDIKARLMVHLTRSPATWYMYDAFFGEDAAAPQAQGEAETNSSSGGGSSS